MTISIKSPYGLEIKRIIANLKCNKCNYEWQYDSWCDLVNLEDQRCPNCALTPTGTFERLERI